MPEPARVSPSSSECQSAAVSLVGQDHHSITNHNHSGLSTYSPYVYQPHRSSQAVVSPIDVSSGSEQHIGSNLLPLHHHRQEQQQNHHHQPMDCPNRTLTQSSTPSTFRQLSHQPQRFTRSQLALAAAQQNPQAPVSDPQRQTSDQGIFADHRDHCYLRGQVENYSPTTEINLGDQPNYHSHWSSWPQNPENNQASLIGFEPAIGDGIESTHSPPQPCSTVHRLVNEKDEDGLDHQLGPTIWAQPLSCRCLVSSNEPSLRSSSQSNETTSTPPDSSLTTARAQSQSFDQKTTRLFSNSRTKEGLPSNSHHLLNSPEMTNLQIVTPSNLNQVSLIGPESEPGFGFGPEGKTPDNEIDKKLDSNPTQPPSFQSPRTTRSSVASRRANTTPKKLKISSSQNPSNDQAGPQADPPSDDAASILLALSRSEPSKHGMALRRGRGGGGSSRPEAPPSSTALPAEKNPPPSTPSGRRYRTRSQIQEGATLHENSSVAPPTESHLPPEISETANGQSKARKTKSNMQLVRALGYGPPPTPCNNGAFASRTGSNDTAAFSFLSQSTAGENLFRTPAQDTCSIYNFIGKAQVDMRGNSRVRVSDGSKAPSTATTGTSASTAAGAGFYPDDDARSSFSISTQATSLIFPNAYMSRRTFPVEVPIDPSFPRLYRAFFVSSAFGEPEPIKALAEKHSIPVLKAPAGSVYNSPAHGFLDLYTPRYVKGVGSEKVGLCCICSEPKERGGEDQELWLKMKVSSYSYHLSFFHGINNANGLPFSPPLEIRHAKRGHVAANEKTELKEGLCHQCNKWIPMEGVKLQEVKVPELFWWKHAKSCHRSRINGESHVHILDEVYDLVTRQQSNQLSQSGGLNSFPSSSCSTPYHYQRLGHDSPLPQCGGSGYSAASPAPTCASSISQSGTSKVHPSVAAQRASAGRIYKRKASSGSNTTNGRKQQALQPPPSDSTNNNNSSNSSNNPGRYSNNCSPYSMGITNSSSSSLPLSLFNHHHHYQQPQSPTPVCSGNDPLPNVSLPRKSRRCNSWNVNE